jgi:hypothetical protein
MDRHLAWERPLLTASAVLTMVGYGVVAAGYFVAPTVWSISLEHWFYRHLPLYHECQLLGALLLLTLWTSGSLLLCRRAWQARRVPWMGTGLAALTPLLLLLLNAAFFFAARHIAPLSLRW